MSQPADFSKEHSITIIGAGFSGICMGIQLKKAGYSNFRIYDKGHGPGGVWRDNTYPGAACDIPSSLYSYSFEQRPDWSRHYAGQREILEYLLSCSKKFGLLEHMQFETEISSASYDEASARWTVATRDEDTWESSIVIFACGQLDRPYVPDLPGLEDFAGTWFHSARWNHESSLEGKNIAVIGNGASAIQFVPHLSKVASRLTIFQRSPNWITRKRDSPISRARQHWCRKIPFFQHCLRVWTYLRLEARFTIFSKNSLAGAFLTRYLIRHLDRRVDSPELRSKLRPDFEVGCKRILLSSEWYKSIQLPNVSVETSGAAGLTKQDVINGEGTDIPAEVVIFATGFESTNFLAPVKISGKNDLDLKTRWKEGAEAYLGMTVPEFPNLFILYGPNTNLAHNSIVTMVEAQSRYILKALNWMKKNEAASLEVRPEVMTSYCRRIAGGSEKTVWVGQCQSWYKNENGRIVNNWPFPSWRYRLATCFLNRKAYCLK